uniref:HNH endonuclease n=1 Tax=Anisakis simplex TaxID=6269 RepID=A0A0M3J6R1_ANISI
LEVKPAEGQVMRASRRKGRHQCQKVNERNVIRKRRNPSRNLIKAQHLDQARRWRIQA